VGLLDVREEYHRQLVQLLDQTLKDRGMIGKLIGGLVKWHHEHGIQAGSWLNMGPVARKSTTAWEAGLTIAGSVGPRPLIIQNLKGKRVDNGCGWGIQRTLRESAVTPLVELGALTLDLLTTAQGTALMGRLKWLGVKDFNTRKMLVKDIALHGAREASRALRTYEWLSRTGGCDLRGGNLRWITRPGPCALARGSSHGGQGESLVPPHTRGSVSLPQVKWIYMLRFLAK